MANVVAFARCGVLWLWLLYNKQEKKRTSEPGWSKTSFQQLGQLGDSLRGRCGQLGAARVVQNIISTAGTAGGAAWRAAVDSWEQLGRAAGSSLGGQLGAAWAGSWGQLEGQLWTAGSSLGRQLDGQLWTAGSSLGRQLGAAWRAAVDSWKQLGRAAGGQLDGQLWTAGSSLGRQLGSFFMTISLSLSCPQSHDV